MKLHCASRPANDTSAEAHRFVIDLDDHGGDHGAALDAARQSVPEDWVLLHTRLLDD